LGVTWDTDTLPSEPVDVGLLVEGTYPYVLGGVSSWIHRLIGSLPEITFSVALLAGRRAEQGPAVYPRLANVRHFACRYLFDQPASVPAPSSAVPRRAFEDVDCLHRQLRTETPQVPLNGRLLERLSRELGEPGGIQLGDLLHGEESWERIRAGHLRDCPRASFTDYFWTVRALHAALFSVAGMARDLPRARAWHAVSTGYAGLLGSILRHRHGRPLILTEHGIYTKERQIDLAAAERLPGDGPDGTGFARRMWMRLFEGLGRITYASADTVIALFEGSRQRQIRDGAIAERTRIIPNGVDLMRFRQLRAKRPPRAPPTLGFIGRVVPIKDVKAFVRAVKAASAVRPDLEGWIVGPTGEDPAYAAECLQLAAALGLENRLKFIGFRKPEDVLPDIGVLVLTSISEGLPLVVPEAFASGVPVITTDVGACRELVEGRTAEDRALGSAGAVVPIADPDAVARAALELLQDEDRYRAAQRAAVQRVERYYSEELVFGAYRQIYGEALQWQA
jgi:glycosyltransferase involved in cell wall biosynthesis